MAEKNKLSISAIQGIIETREDKNLADTGYPAISKMLLDRFGIKVSPQAVRYQYQTKKENPEFLNRAINSRSAVSAPSTSQNLENETEKPKQTNFDFSKFRKNRANTETTPKEFDKSIGDNLSKEDLDLLLGRKQ